jgi:hypothetical protein
MSTPTKLDLFAFSGAWDAEKMLEKVRESVQGSFYMCNLSDVLRKFDDWRAKMPRVSPFYAVSSL